MKIGCVQRRQFSVPVDLTEEEGGEGFVCSPLSTFTVTDETANTAV